MERIRNFFKKLSFETIKLPENVKKFANKIIIISFLGTLIPDILSFALKGAQISLEKGMTVVAIVLLLINFSQRILDSLFRTFYSYQNDSYKKLTTSESTKVILDISNLTKSKIFKKRNNIIQMVELPEVLKVSKDYLQDYWSFYIQFPKTLCEVLILIGTLIASIILEIRTSTLVEALILSGLLIICCILYFLNSKQRIQVMRKYRKARKENEAAEDVLFTEIKSTDFISKKDFVYHAERFRTKLDENTTINRDENLKLNKVFIKRSMIASFMIIAIIVVKLVFEAGINLNSFIDIIALSSIYSTILQRISSIASSYENIMDIVIDIDTLYDEFSNINKVYVAEKSKILNTEPIKNLTIANFSISQDLNGAFELINTSSFTVNSGDTIMAYGKTGSGKSTLINMLTGRMSLLENPIQFSNGQVGYLNTIGYQTDKSMVNNFVLNEIALTDDLEQIDKEKLFYLLRGFHLFEEIHRMVKKTGKSYGNTVEEEVFEFLKVRKTKEFSSGQMQRLALVKLLYSLDSSIQLVALDEPFNRLDDETTKQCVKFIQDYVMTSNRILLIATHQVEIVRNFSNMEISFIEDLEKSIIKVVRK